MLLTEFFDGLKGEQENGQRWQIGFAELIRKVRPQIVVETGVSHGVSTAFILDALPGDGRLHSVDPDPVFQIEHPKWTLWRKYSCLAMPEIFRKTGPWDVFLHDSDHGAECQTFEYELAWHLVKFGGIIATDDPIWGTHKAWEKFCNRHGVSPTKIGSCEYVRKTGHPISASQLGTLIHTVEKLAIEAGEEDFKETERLKREHSG